MGAFDGSQMENVAGRDIGFEGGRVWVAFPEAIYFFRLARSLLLSFACEMFITNASQQLSVQVTRVEPFESINIDISH